MWLHVLVREASLKMHTDSIPFHLVELTHTITEFIVRIVQMSLANWQYVSAIELRPSSVTPGRHVCTDKYICTCICVTSGASCPVFVHVYSDPLELLVVSSDQTTLPIFSLASSSAQLAQKLFKHWEQS